ncbi:MULTISPECIES: 3-phosphoglycerate kinase [unclassified Pseudomonas]|uniref:3-phosphoglycerate kinase n=1 Tax=unclassified Pseudomonas TaxID=196821 RepID=UPI000C883ADB|nr:MULTISPECIES: 3-phosphoglycerate kinase [unclassified Pseudomonas]PMZ93371.1 3-phosphoglycerate kinase [Pseudomonas sp. FW305-42]PNA27772.1 3-phosphoglycerate kinase [Pseudomonas sp. MPR-R1B]PNB29510.1 3-phosphoglycerate kinase [Pseudomonas sp. DP16D-E2]PNB45067.1 3-phosphoglycerate kinase [Pseudomonas sp. FW305-17]PNB57506.1 3-phosphoglycerate kinase [Pseudomonas sp. GW531-E2]
MKKCCAALLLCLPLGVMAYPIDVEKDLTGVKVDYTAYDTAYDIGSISLNNYGQVPAACKVIFRNGPEAPRVRRVNVPAGRSVDVTAKFNRQIIRLRIVLDCKAE